MPTSSSDLYLCVREREGRLYPDDVVSRLPEFRGDTQLTAEWRIRANSISQLTQYLARRERPLTILELGCGNGWLSSQLSRIPETRVWGLDRFSSELIQARRVFRHPNMAFLTADIFTPPFSSKTFDVVVLASVIQYFPDLAQLIKSLQQLIDHEGEIHIIDSPIYRQEEIPHARERTEAYYTGLGFPEMAGYYYHHSVTILDEFPTSWLYHPGSIPARLKRLVGKDASPFPWVVIRS